MNPAPTALSRGDLLCALGVVVIWGLNFVVMKLGLHGLSPMLLGALRFAAASLPLLLFMPRPALPMRWVALYGLTQGLGQFGLLFLGIALGMTAGMASVVMQTQAFFTLLLAVPLLGERARLAQWLGLAVALIGLVAIATASTTATAAQGTSASQQMTLAGFVLTLSAAFMWALSNLVARLASRVAEFRPLPFIVWSSLFPVLPFVLLALAFDGPAEIGRQLAGIGPIGLLAVAYLAWLATLLAYTLWTQLLQRHPAGRVTPFSLLVPVVGLWAAWWVFDERPLPAQWLGTALILLGLLINQAGSRLARALGALRGKADA